MIVVLLITIYLFLIPNISGFLDNENYLKSYENIQTAETIAQSYTLFHKATGANEPMYFLLQYSFSDFLSYEVFNGVINFVFLFILYLLVKKYFRKDLTAFIIILFFDYYMYRLTGELHRFKLAILFFMLFLYFQNTKYRFVSAVLSLSSHFQMLIIYPIFILRNLKINRYIKINTLFYILVAIIAIGIFSALFSSSLIYKIQHYASLRFPTSSIIIAILYFLYLFINKDKRNIVNFTYLSLIIIPVASIIGSDRLNIFLMEFIFFVELYKLLELNRKISAIVVLSIMFYNIFRMREFL